MSLKAFLAKFFPTKTEVVRIPAPPSVFAEKIHGDGRELPYPDYGGQLMLGVIVGHTEKEQGAAMVKPLNLKEYSYNSMVAEEMLAYAKKTYPSLYVTIIKRGDSGIAAAYDQARALLCDCVIELHFNAHNGGSQGTETLCTPDLSDVDFAHVIHKKMVEIFKREGKTDRGVITLSKSARGGVNVHSFPGGVNCLVEPFFGDNASDAKLGMDNMKFYAHGLVDAVQLWAKKVDLIKT